MKTKLLLTIVMCVITASAGCANRGGILGVDCLADVKAGAIPEPAGSKTCSLHQTQVNAAAIDRNVLYRADFVGSSTRLAPAAMERLARQKSAGSLGSQQVIIEPSGDVNLDHSRLASLQSLLVDLGNTNADVIIAIPPALGLAGPFAENSLSAVQQSSGASSGSNGLGLGSNF